MTLRKLGRRIRALLTGRRLEAELDEELRFREETRDARGLRPLALRAE